MCGDASVDISEEERVGPFPTFSSFEMGSTPKKVLTLWTSRADGKTDGGGGGFESHEKLDISDGKIDMLTAETTTSPILFPSDVSSQADHDRASGSARSSDLQRQIDELRAEVRASREEILLAIQNGYREDPAVRAESEGLRGDDENNGWGGGGSSLAIRRGGDDHEEIRGKGSFNQHLFSVLSNPVWIFL
jgi:hypothetical protein